jgi:hypothetical protein
VLAAVLGDQMSLTADQISARAVADLIEKLRLVNTATHTMTIRLFESPNFETALADMGLTLPHGTTVSAQRKDLSWYERPLDLRQAVDEIKADQELRLLFGEAVTIGMVSLVGDAIQRAGLYRAFPSPEMEFLRHVRNAMSHGSTFFFSTHKNGINEPVNPASFGGLRLHHNLHGTSLWDLVWSGDVYELLDHIEAYLRSV